MKSKFKINQELFFKDCTKEYQLKNIFIPKFIKVVNYIGKPAENEEQIKFDYFVYSENNYSFYPENTLTTNLSKI